MKQCGFPAKQGLYDSQFEHDACGMGFVAHLEGKKSNAIVKQALEILENLTHRGAVGAEKNTGDGAGILMQMPHEFYKKEFKKCDIDLPEKGQYGIAFIFLPKNYNERVLCMETFESIVESKDMKVLGWREVEVDNSMIGKAALNSEPVMKQAVVIPNYKIEDKLFFERRLYVIRRLVENQMAASDLKEKHLFYFSSFSANTVVYKGMLTPEQVRVYFKDIHNPELETGIAMVHSRFSTNTFPSWDRAHPNRYLIHNGEINTLRGNLNWLRSREALIDTDIFDEDMKKLLPIANPNASDSGNFDNTLEFLYLSGRSLPHCMMMMVPEPWDGGTKMSETKKAFYEYHSCVMEPWDGPASMGFTDGEIVGALLDRNGLRPSRYYVTHDDIIVLASEVGVMSTEPENIKMKKRLEPGKMLLVDTNEGRIIEDEELKENLASEKPYSEWVKKHKYDLKDLDSGVIPPKVKNLRKFQKTFGYTHEELIKGIKPMAVDGKDPVGAMGTDSPIAVLSKKNKLLFDYFHQLFAQVTNPPIDGIREEIVTSSATSIGKGANLISIEPDNCDFIRSAYPILTNEDLSKLRDLNNDVFKTAVLPITFNKFSTIEAGLHILFNRAKEAVENGYNILILSDRGVDDQYVPLPSLLAVAGLHHFLINEGLRSEAGLVLESAEPRLVHHFATLIGYGVSSVNPYLAFETIEDMIEKGIIKDLPAEKAIKSYVKASTKGIMKVMSKMGISTIQSYRGAQIFECLGLSDEVIDKYFTRTPSRIDGIGLEEIQIETMERYNNGFKNFDFDKTLDPGSILQYRKDGELHLYNPETIYLLQQAVRQGDYKLYKEYSSKIGTNEDTYFNLRALMDFDYSREAINIDEVEPASSIVKRFKTGAMSYGSISKEAHETIAIAMNRLGGKSNSGEGGEEVSRFIPDANGDLRRSAIKQIASGRFGVTSNYLTNATELQIKLAQGAKPGEGGHLPGRKVFPWIANTRGTTTGVGLISPPPHHDIYSIEDLAELIHDLKNANREARVNVKLVSEVGVGTIAAGVAKAKADVILISGYDGGTGAAPRTSIRHGGLPWELGLAETQQTLLLNNLRSRVVLETDGKLMTGRDVAVAALLGAEEFGFATLPLVAVGCVMMRVCNLNTCPVGVATQDPNLRENFTGKPEYVENMMLFIAEELREYMAALGFRTVNEMIGRSDLLKKREDITHYKAKKVSLDKILHNPEHESASLRNTVVQDHELEESLDLKVLLDACKPAIENRDKVELTLPIINTNRVVGTIIGNEISKKYGLDGLPEDTIKLNLHGSAGQSMAAFAPKGMTFNLSGDTNDYVGKGLSGAKVIVAPEENTTFVPEDNIIVGNVSFYGATGGEAYIRGVGGERFCVRNSGVKAVIEGIGDHGCEYMTGGVVLNLGRTGKNFGAGMSGGVAYVYDKDKTLQETCNTEMVTLTDVCEEDDIRTIKDMISAHIHYTNSNYAKNILDDFKAEDFTRVMPDDYYKVIKAIKKYEGLGLDEAEARLKAFQESL